MRYLRPWRKFFGITQSELADAAGTTFAAISAIETDKSAPSEAMLRAIVEAAESLRPGRGITAGQIIGTEEWTEPYVPSSPPPAIPAPAEAGP